jgi:hypothetical protein
MTQNGDEGKGLLWKGALNGSVYWRDVLAHVHLLLIGNIQHGRRFCYEQLPDAC